MVSSPAKIRALTEPSFLLQWCRDNIVVPLGPEQNHSTTHQHPITTIGDPNDWARVGNFIKQRVSNPDLKCQCIEQRRQEIRALSDQATQAGQTHTADPPQRGER